MFYIEFEDGNCLTVGYDGLTTRFELYGFDFGNIIELEQWETIAEMILQRLPADVKLGMERIKEGLIEKADVDKFMKELEDDRNPIYYDYYRPLFSLPDLKRRMAEIRNAKAARIAKKIHGKSRRAQFNRERDILVLRLIESGRPYVCAKLGCSANTNLTVDHLLAITRGGSDDLTNLQFLCLTHNSEKGDRPQ